MKQFISTESVFYWDEKTQKLRVEKVDGYWYDGPVVQAMDSPTFRQHQIQLFNDDGTDETDSTSKAGVGVDITGQVLDENIVVRFLVQETAGNSQANYKPVLEIRLNGGTYVSVNGVDSTIGRASNSTILVDGEDSTQRIGSGTFLTPNQGVDDVNGVAGMNAINFVGNDETEFVYCFQVRSADVSAGDNVEVRISPATIDVYGDPEIKITIAAAGPPTANGTPILEVITASGVSTVIDDTLLADGSPILEALVASGVVDQIQKAFGKEGGGGFPVISQTRVSKDTGTVDSYVADYPAGSIAADDLLLIFIAAGPHTFFPPTITVATGVLETGVLQNGSASSWRIFYRKATGAEGGGTFTVTHPTTDVSGVCVVVHITGWDDTISPEGTTEAHGDNDTPDSPDLNPSGWGTLPTKWLTFRTAQENPLTSIAPTNYSGVFNASSIANIAVAERDLEVASENPGPWDVTSGLWDAVTIAVPGISGGLEALSIEEITASGVATLADDAKTANGNPLIEGPTASGVSTQILKPSGDPTLAEITASGVSKIIKKATGAAILTAIIAAGVATLSEPPVANGNPLIDEITASGISTIFKRADGDPAIDSLTAVGVVDQTYKPSGAPSIEGPTASGISTIFKRATGDPELSEPIASGQSIQTYKPSGTPAIPEVTASGQSTQTLKPSGTPTIEVITASGVAGLGGIKAASGDPLLEEPTAIGVVDQTYKPSGAPVVTGPTAVGVSVIIKSGSGIPEIDSPTAIGTSTQVYKPSGTPVVSSPIASGISTILKRATGDPVLDAIAAAGVSILAGDELPSSGNPLIDEITASGVVDQIYKPSGVPSIDGVVASGVSSQILKPTGVATLEEITASGVSVIVVGLVASGDPTLEVIRARGLSIGAPSPFAGFRNVWTNL